MISNERPSPYGNRPHGDRPHGDRPYGAPKAPINEDTLDVGGRHDTIIIPAPGLEEFRTVLDEMVKISAETPPKTPDPETGE